MRKSIALAAALALASAANAQNIDAPPPPPSTYSEVMDQEVPVTAGDITDRPYRVVGLVEKEIRRATMFSRDASAAKVYRELWEKAQKLGADAVVNARFGDGRVTLFSWGSRRATGQAVKFLSDDEIARRGAAGSIGQGAQ